jgi:hypothetical protein
MRGSGGADGSADGYQAANSGAMSVSDPCTPNPCLIPPAPTCDADGKTLVKKQPPVTCAVVDGNAQCNWTTATQDCSTVGICEAGARMPIPMPFKNEMIVTEFMARSDSGQSDKGEWVELYNNSGKRLNLGGCLLKDNGSNSYTIPSPMLVNAGAYLLFAQSGVAAENHALPTPDAVYSNFTLANTGDAIILNCAGVDVDKFVYTSNAAAPLGKSFQLDPTKYDATLNDTVGNWCASSTTFGTAGSCSRYQTPDAPTDCFGTPKAANVSCGLP